ncbi:beta and beta-prime subunits of DNA dependent RNA-polymerase [Piedraia hortae CBS 480.64]|uniref:DNA-directed RNA polymerase subunit beta n=1 Tax=Piedraia hortae CBS 480.64 TaxID=1314780 RepID=A0A6A7BT29_9PEZI|nr:beta and beta-prime subunits of DNA dependent RNA-polymerase [Piedraia hortae CBS 480.64]
MASARRQGKAPIRRENPAPTMSAASATKSRDLPAHRDEMEDLMKPYHNGRHLSDPVNTAKDKWLLLPAFLRVKGLVKQHLDSFDHFTDHTIKEIVHANRIIRSEQDHTKYIEFTDIRVGRPERKVSQNIESKVTPHECRLRDMTYAAPIHVDIIYTKASGRFSQKNIQIGRMPIMLRSSRCVLHNKSENELAVLNECPIDPGGYFIARGQEKVILIQEQLSKNRILVESFRGVLQASVTSYSAAVKTKTYVVAKKGLLYLKHSSMSDDIPIVIALRGMGIQSDMSVLLLVAGNDELYQDKFLPNIEEAARLGVFTQEQALDYIASKLRPERFAAKWGGTKSPRQQALDKLAVGILPHVGVKDLDFYPKALYLAFMGRRVIMAMHSEKQLDDRDYLGNKRFELAGQMIALLFEQLFKDYCGQLKKDMDTQLKKNNPTKEFNAYDTMMMHSNFISDGLERAIATGTWNLKRFRMDRAGVTHLVSRLSYISALGMMTRISAQFEKTRKVSGPRALQPSQFGMLCTSDTPEGEQCGLVKNLALMTHITTSDPEEPVLGFIFSIGAESISQFSGSDLYSQGVYLIFLNGTPVALTRKPKQFLDRFRHLRRKGRISEFVSVYINHNHNGVHIATDEGRICRPLIIVENGRSKATAEFLTELRDGKKGFQDALKLGIVEYLDVNEENDTYIAMSEKKIRPSSTHLEIEPFTILGAVAGLIPYPHHNQSPRNTYQCAMGKQAIGAIGYNQLLRQDTLLYLMVYPQKPLVTTRAIELIKYDKLPAGQNAIVAVTSLSGYDIEDALVINKASCDRGFGRCQVFRKMMVPLKTHQNGEKERLIGPNSMMPRERKIGKDGLAEVGSKLEAGDSVVLKEVPPPDGVGWKKVAQSYSQPDPAYVDKIIRSDDDNGSRFVKATIRQTRRPEVGDKFSSRHGQKGVTGLILPQEDLPFSDQGITPDIIMNPHGFPSRMTVGKMIELLAGKAGVIHGKQEYGTAFGGSKVKHMGQALVEAGFSYSGKDFMTSGITGESYKRYIFFGPIYYQKLKHMVQDKMHARAKGPVQLLTRQPVEGRAKKGGLRLGEMERDCLIAYGTSQLLLERLMYSSDAHEVEICDVCGNMGYHNWCQTCRSSRAMAKVTIPYAAKLLIQELISMGVRATLKLEDEFPLED